MKRALVLLALCAACGDDVLDAGARAQYPQAGLFTPGSLLGYVPPPDAGRGDGGNGLTPEEQRELEDRIASAGMEDRCVGVDGEPGTSGELRGTFKSASYGGHFDPKNCGAVWIEDESGMYVATVEMWAQVRVRTLFVWDGRRCRADPLLDVVSSATLNEHGTHSFVWDGRSHDGARVPNGTYVLNIEITEDELNYGRHAEFPFEWGPGGFSMTPQNATSVKDLRIDFTPIP